MRLITIAAAAVLLFVAVSTFIRHEAQKELRASAALSDIPAVMNLSTSPPPDMVQAYLKVAQEHPGTRAAGRAILLAASALFMDGQYEQANTQFARFLKEYPGSSWTSQASLGRAKCLDALRQYDAAQKEYEDIRKRFANTSIADEATLALAQIFETEKKSEEAIKLYHALSEASQSSVGARAGLRKEQMLKENPALTNSLPPPPAPPVVSQPVPQVLPFLQTNVPGRTGAAPAVANLTNIIRLTPTTSTPVTVVTSAPAALPGTNLLQVQPPPPAPSPATSVPPPPPSPATSAPPAPPAPPPAP